MNDGMNRREFLKYSVAAGVMIASGHALKAAGLAEETQEAFTMINAGTKYTFGA